MLLSEWLQGQLRDIERRLEYARVNDPDFSPATVALALQALIEALLKDSR